MGGMAVAFGATSYFVGNSYLDSQTQARLSQIETSRTSDKSIATSKVAVAKKRLKFGETLTDENIKLINWPNDTIPAGTFSDVSNLVADGNRRALAAIEEGELILSVKVTGEHARSGLAGIITDGKRAVTIPVNAVDGVGGFIQPGDLVDLVLTTGNNETGEMTSEVLMESVKVLSVDQKVGERSETARIAQTVTLETDIEGAKKITLGRTSGQVSLLLRGAGPQVASKASSTSFIGDLLSFNQKKKTKSVRVVAGENSYEFKVRIEEQQGNQVR